MSTLNQEVARLQQAKSAIDEVLIARGVTIPENATLDTYYQLIESIKGGTSSEEVTATKANVLAGTTTITADSNDEIVEGTMPNNSGQAKGTDNVYFDDSYMQVAIKYPGYYDENSTIRIGKSNFGNATADKVLDGTTYSSSEGLNLSGNIPIKSADTYFASTNDLTIDAGQYLGGTQTIKGLTQTNFSPANIKTGVTVKINNGDRDLFSATGTFGSDATLASAANLLTGNIAYGKDGTKYTGSMPNNGAVAPSALGAGGSYTIPAGYHDGNGKVTVQSLATLTASGDATAAQILTGKKAYVDGSLITGTMADQGAKTSSLNCGGSYTIPAGYHNGSGKITANSLSSQTSATATTSTILSGYTAYVNGSKITGTVAVSSLLSFSAAPYSATQITFTWKNPAKGAFSGVIIVGKTGSTPTSISDGTRYYKGYGSSYTASGTSTATVSGFTKSTTYYFRAFPYATKDNAEWTGTSSTASATTKPQGSQTFTSSGTFTVPANVTSIDIFCVGGGGAAGSYMVRSGGGGAYVPGAGGGYTATKKAYAVTPGATFAVTIGAGGAAVKASADLHGTLAATGGTTSFGSVVSASGGKGTHHRYAGGSLSITSSMCVGGAGGSGGGGSGGADSGRNAGDGGSDGSNGGTGTDSTWTNAGGKGQGTTTRAFAESSNTLYAGGGGGGAYGLGKYGAGGAGGGAAGTGYGNDGNSGSANTGGGGGGIATLTSSATNKLGGSGGSGICIVRWGY